MRLKDKVAIITGAGTGIGRETALLFAEEGAKVVIAELKPELGRKTEELVREAGGDALFIETDATDNASVQAAVERAMETYGAIHVLHNCAGGSIPQDGPVTKVEDWVWDFTMTLDLKSAVVCCRHAIPHIIEAGGGAVINMSSTAALQGNRATIYSAAKGGVISLTRSLASQYAVRGVRVNAICPGMVLTDRAVANIGTLPEYGGSEDSPAARTVKRYPFGVGLPREIAQIALFLASDASRMINAASIPADGGMSAYSAFGGT